ncbi:hypothetical protein I4U23_030934 [Adineta vaga]|nr:hypothetical protein I4U23_030934 [Adineta vaga]
MLTRNDQVSLQLLFQDEDVRCFVNISLVFCHMKMSRNIRFIVFLIFYLNIRKCWSDLTGTHYLHMINCSSSSLYIPQGPYQFSHHWPFTSITIEYQKQISRGTCYRDGSLHFILNNDKICSGIYYAGQAKLLCQYENDDYCLIRMKTTDERRLTCNSSKIQSITIFSMGFLFLILFFYTKQYIN